MCFAWITFWQGLPLKRVLRPKLFDLLPYLFWWCFTWITFWLGLRLELTGFPPDTDTIMILINSWRTCQSDDWPGEMILPAVLPCSGRGNGKTTDRWIAWMQLQGVSTMTVIMMNSWRTCQSDDWPGELTLLAVLPCSGRGHSKTMNRWFVRMQLQAASTMIVIMMNSWRTFQSNDWPGELTLLAVLPCSGRGHSKTMNRWFVRMQLQIDWKIWSQWFEEENYSLHGFTYASIMPWWSYLLLYSDDFTLIDSLLYALW